MIKESLYFQRGTTHLVWLKGRGPLSSLAGLEISDAKASGMSRTELYRVTHKKPKFPENVWQLELLAHRVQVPNKETTYWCRVHKLPTVLRQKYVSTYTNLICAFQRISERSSRIVFLIISQRLKFTY